MWKLLKAMIDTAVQAEVVKPVEFERVIVDTTVPEKAITHSVDSRLLEIARGKIVSAVKPGGIALNSPIPMMARNYVARAMVMQMPSSSDVCAKPFPAIPRMEDAYVE